ncbi:NUDIX hydrolase domain-like protein [Lentinula edodes]|uniref:Oxidized purine nucleoside triphosphate hydrolase n=1 Tax=Lentinula lateritia TaxID=40482 RepID=A0A9W8ZQ45_9AGAR|nr:NUDIX hydrolase domain-like protein [Lentinula edodes]
MSIPSMPESIPGLEKDFNLLRETVSGGTSTRWMDHKKVKFYTNAFIFHGNKVLLGYKKRGFGLHKYNGFGGKVELGETSLEAAARELEEEAGIKSALKHIGILFFLSDGEDCAFHIDIYRGDGFAGVITESEEMRPEWFSTSADNSPDTGEAPSIPYEQLWETDPYWFPYLLSNTPFRGRADFRMDSEKGKLLPCKWWFGVLGGSAEVAD